MYRGIQTNRLTIRHHLHPVEDEFALSRGQIVVIFGLLLMALVGIMGIAIDLTYSFIAETRMQKAADAGALAGAVYLPDNPTKAISAAETSVAQNGFVTGDGTVVHAEQDKNPVQMDVSVSDPVPTFFMRVFGINQLTPTRTARAQFNLPVPMGSPVSSFGDPNDHDLQGNHMNFWAAVNGPCTTKANGDPYATKDTDSGSSNCVATGKKNKEYKNGGVKDPGAYDYAIDVPAAGTLTIELYDPEFCSRANSPNQFDAGDYIYNTNSNFETVFSLYKRSDTPYDLSTDDFITATAYPGDQSTSTADGVGGRTHSCSAYYVTKQTEVIDGQSQTDWHANGWIGFATVTVDKPGTYRLNVESRLPTGWTGAAEGSNPFSIRTTLNGGAGVQPQVYAGLAGTQAAMSILNNAPAGDSYIYLANVGGSLAGKTMEVDLFDPGDVNSGDGQLSFHRPPNNTCKPANGAYIQVPISYRDAGTDLSPNGATSSGNYIQTASAGKSLFNGHWVAVTMEIPADYNPAKCDATGKPSVTGKTDGWWKIKYHFTGKPHDRTTWRVSIQDNPVHLVP